MEHHTWNGMESILHFFAYPNHWGPVAFVLILFGIAAWKMKAHQRNR
jgi:hypothetical protein